MEYMNTWKYINGQYESNYHLTFSLGSSNKGEAKKVLKMGGNIAVVFRNKKLLTQGKIFITWLKLNIGNNNSSSNFFIIYNNKLYTNLNKLFQKLFYIIIYK